MPVAHRQALRDQLHTLALAIGLRPAARKLGVNESTASVWAKRGQWQIRAFQSMHLIPSSGRKLKANGSVAHEVLEQTLREQSNDSRLYLSAAGLKASYEAAQCDGAALLTKDKSIAVLNHARSLDTVHGWSAERAQPTQIQVAAVIMPTAEERAERRTTDAKLDAIAAELRARALPEP